MKYGIIYINIILLFLIGTSCSPTKTVLCAGETFVINSVNKTTFSNGINRNSYTAKLPKKTKFVIINVLVDNKDSESNRRNAQELLNSLAESGIDSNFKLMGGIAIASMMPPSTGKYCDFYMFPNRQNFDAFMQEGTIANWKGKWNCLPEPYRKRNTQSFNLVIDINDLPDHRNIYLGFLNHNLTNACKIILDVIAIK